ARVTDNLRRVKDPGELASVREAVRLTGLGIASILTHMAPGVGEWQLQAHFDFALKMNGAMGNAFYPIIAGGENSVSLHYDRNDQILKAGDVLLLDLGAESDYYSADISRTFPVSGTFTPEQRTYYNAVLHAQKRVVEALRPGLHIDETYAIAKDGLYEYCSAHNLPHTRADMDQLLPHGVVHYLGLDTHDVGDRVELQPGMTVAIEPGIYLRDRGLGIRIEDDALITADGCELLSAQILKDPDEIEDFIIKNGRNVN
ncbi:MAG: M24 family metallopeptidase, partial [Pseudoflavonifractor sp.]